MGLTESYFWKTFDSPGITVDWSCLPDLALVKICSFLQDKDRGHFALVCCNWQRAFIHPTLWRYCHIDLGTHLPFREERIMKKILSIGNHLHHLKVFSWYEHTELDELRTSTEQILELLRLKNTQLRKLCVHLIFKGDESLLSTYYVEPIAEFLQTQIRLKVLKITCEQRQDSSFSLPVDILKECATNPTPYSSSMGVNMLTSLSLVGENFRLPDKDQESRLIQTLSRFNQLQEFGISYLHFSEELFEKLMETNPTLTLLSLFYTDNVLDILRVEVPSVAGGNQESLLPAIRCTFWSRATSRFPRLRVKFDIDTRSFDRLSSILPAKTPLIEASLSLIHNKEATLKYLADNFHSTLEGIRLDMAVGLEDTLYYEVSSLLNFFHASSKLARVNIEMWQLGDIDDERREPIVDMEKIVTSLCEMVDVGDLRKLRMLDTILVDYFDEDLTDLRQKLTDKCQEVGVRFSLKSLIGITRAQAQERGLI